MTEQKLIIKKAIKHFECMKSDAQVVLDSGFGTHEGESDLVYKNRKIYAQMAIDALEKQIPKKVDNITLVYDNGLPYGYIGKCPNCGDIIEDDSNYCICNCGQKVLWEEE